VCSTDSTELVLRGEPLDPFINLVMDARLKVERYLGAGGMGHVYIARQLDATQRLIAVKFIRAELLEHKEDEKRFFREIRTLASAAHSNVVSVYFSGHARVAGQKIPYFAMELLKGLPLSDLVGHGTRLEVRRSCRIVLSILRGLGALHKAGIVHRDLKPANVLLLDGQDDQVKILDFGLAKSKITTDEEIAVTVGNVIMGTPAYMSPEQMLGWNLDDRSDLYSVGMILYELVTGYRPLRDKSGAIPTADLAFPELGLPEPLCKLVSTLVAMDRERRPKTATEVHAALQEIADTLPSQRPHTTLPRSGMPSGVAEFASAETMLSQTPGAQPLVRPPGSPPADSTQTAADFPGSAAGQAAPPAASSQLPPAPQRGGTAPQFGTMPAPPAAGTTETDSFTGSGFVRGGRSRLYLGAIAAGILLGLLYAGYHLITQDDSKKNRDGQQAGQAVKLDVKESEPAPAVDPARPGTLPYVDASQPAPPGRDAVEQAATPGNMDLTAEVGRTRDVRLAPPTPDTISPPPADVAPEATSAVQDVSAAASAADVEKRTAPPDRNVGGKRDRDRHIKRPKLREIKQPSERGDKPQDPAGGGTESVDGDKPETLDKPPEEKESSILESD